MWGIYIRRRHMSDSTCDYFSGFGGVRMVVCKCRIGKRCEGKQKTIAGVICRKKTNNRVGGVFHSSFLALE